MEAVDRILVVDDDSVSMMIVEKILTDAGYAVDTGVSGKAALAYLEKTKPKMIILDVILPDIIGTDLCVKIRRMPEFSTIPIILVSGVRVSKRDYQFGLEIGASDYISRPFEKNDFLQSVNRLLHYTEMNNYPTEDSGYKNITDRSTELTAQIFEQENISAMYPDEFDKLVVKYTKLLKLSLEHRIYKKEDSPEEQCQSFAGELGFLKASARDIVDIHQAALLSFGKNQSTLNRFFVKEESRILLITVMGYLLDYYRINR